MSSGSDTNRAWALLPSKPEKLVQAMFHASVTVIVGDGGKTLFWSDRWIDGCSVAQLAPNLVQAVCKRLRKACLVREALNQATWIRDISGSLFVLALQQYVSRLGTVAGRPTPGELA